MLCTDGTSFDVENGVCRPDITACGAGLVLYQGECRDAADIDADYNEGAEPNDGANGQAVSLAPDADSAITIKGCIGPVGNAADGDTYIITTSAPMLIDVMVDGYNGLSGAFMVNSASDMLNANGWKRYGLNLFNDMAHREVFLPVAGDYWLTVTDGRSLLDHGRPVGNGETCYLATITTREMTAPSPINGTVSGVMQGHVLGYELIASENDVIYAHASSMNDTVLIDTVLMHNGAYVSSSTADMNVRPLGSDAGGTVAGTAAGDQVVAVIDPVIDYGIDSAAFELTMRSAGPLPLPGDGSTAEVPNNGIDTRFLYFAVDAGDVVHLRFGSDAPGGLNAAVVDTNLDTVADLCTECIGYDNYIYFAESGVYFLALHDLSSPAPASFQLTSERIHHTPSALTTGTSLTGEALGADGSAFYTLDFNAIDWVAFDGGAVDNFIGDLELRFYGRSRSGSLGGDLTLGDMLGLTGGEVGRIFEGGSQFLIRARDDGFLVGTPGTYDVSLMQRPFTHLGSINGVDPVELLGIPMDAGEFQRFIAEGPVFTAADVVVGGAGFDAVVYNFDRFENFDVIDSGFSGDDETFTARLAPSAFLALGVEEWDGAPGSYDIRIDGDLPPMQVVAGHLPMKPVCPSEGGAGEVVAMSGDDDGFSLGIQLATPFSHLGVPVEQVVLNTNGYLTFDLDPGGYNNWTPQGIPSSARPNNYMTGFWSDLDNVRVCMLSTSTHTVVQWDGVEWGVGTPASHQVVLHGNNHIDMIYGFGHRMSSGDATIGLENAAGDAGFEMGAGTNGLANPGTSWTLIP